MKTKKKGPDRGGEWRRVHDKEVWRGVHEGKLAGEDSPLNDFITFLTCNSYKQTMSKFKSNFFLQQIQSMVSYFEPELLNENELILIHDNNHCYAKIRYHIIEHIL